jgi:hypothetical protein
MLSVRFRGVVIRKEQNSAIVHPYKMRISVSGKRLHEQSYSFINCLFTLFPLPDHRPLKGRPGW